MKKLILIPLWCCIVLGLFFFSSRTALALDCATYLLGIEKACELSSDDGWEYSDCVYANMASGGFEDKEHYTRAGRDADGYPLFTCGSLVCVKAFANANEACSATEQNPRISCFRSSLAKSGLTEGRDFEYSPKEGRLFCK